MHESILLDSIKISENGCWEWTGYRVFDGYGQILISYRNYKTHRLAMYFWRGFKLNSKQMVLHHCDNPPCCNPDHLYLGSAKDNARDREVRKRSNPRYGTKHHSSKLNEKDVIEIRKAIADGQSQVSLAKKYKISTTQVCNINKRTEWAHVL